MVFCGERATGTYMAGEEVTGSNAYAYSNELLVEVTCRDADNHLVVRSYPFDFVGDDEVSPTESIPDEHVDAVRDAVREKGYRFVDSPTP